MCAVKFAFILEIKRKPAWHSNSTVDVVDSWLNDEPHKVVMLWQQTLAQPIHQIGCKRNDSWWDMWPNSQGVGPKIQGSGGRFLQSYQ